MLSRLDELRRHRAMLQEHLALLEQEIAEELGRSQGAAPAPRAASVAPARPLPTPSAAAEADKLFAQFRAEEEKNNAPPSKSGCWMIFWLILLLFAGAVGGLVYFLYR